MIQFKTKIGDRGQLVIPKLIRETLGITKNKVIFLEVEDKILTIKPVEEKDIIQSWKNILAKEGTEVSKKFIYGDKLYEEIF